MTEMHYDDPSFEIVDPDEITYDALLGSRPVVLERTDERPTGELEVKSTRLDDADVTHDDEDHEVLREN